MRKRVLRFGLSAVADEAAAGRSVDGDAGGTGSRR